FPFDAAFNSLGEKGSSITRRAIGRSLIALLSRNCLGTVRCGGFGHRADFGRQQLSRTFARNPRLLSRPHGHASMDVLRIGALLSGAAGISRAGRESERQNKDQTEWFHDGIRARQLLWRFRDKTIQNVSI